MNPDQSPRQYVAAALRSQRVAAGLSLSEAARAAGIGKSTLSQLESGNGNPSLETLWSLAAVFDIPLSTLLEQPAARFTLLRAGDAIPLASSVAHYTATLLSAQTGNRRRDIYLISAQPGAVRQSQPHPVGTIEHVICSSGHARVQTDDTDVELRPGDYISYPGDRPHEFEALADDTRSVFVIES